MSRSLPTTRPLTCHSVSSNNMGFSCTVGRTMRTLLDEGLFFFVEENRGCLFMILFGGASNWSWCHRVLLQWHKEMVSGSDLLFQLYHIVTISALSNHVNEAVQFRFYAFLHCAEVLPRLVLCDALKEINFFLCVTPGHIVNILWLLLYLAAWCGPMNQVDVFTNASNNQAVRTVALVEVDANATFFADFLAFGFVGALLLDACHLILVGAVTWWHIPSPFL